MRLSELAEYGLQLAYLLMELLHRFFRALNFRCILSDG